MGTTRTTEERLRETVRSVCRQHPVHAAFLFGSRATGATHPNSDIDIAIVFEDSSSSEQGYNDVLLGLAADLAEALGTDDIDVVDLERASPALTRSILDDGELLVGDDSVIYEVYPETSEANRENRTPRERFDDLLSDIDEHLA